MNNVLIDNVFLEKLYKHTEKEVFVKIISLDLHENPREEITGKVASGGSITIDGASSMRRTCNISITPIEVNINDLYWTNNTKFKVMVGLANTIDLDYDEIIWFPMGVYLITNFSQSYAVGNYNISITGKDKMCLLDGSVSGALFSNVDFGKIETILDDGTSVYESIPLYDIIKNAIHLYGNEPYQNIIINDLDNVSVELLDYKISDQPMYVYIESDNKLFSDYSTQIAFPGLGEMADNFANWEANHPKKDITAEYLNYNGMYQQVKKKVNFGETAGYRKTALTYPGDLMITAGGTVVNLLDQLVGMLGEFEYFYDLEGRFIFQRKQIYVNMSWENNIESLGNPNKSFLSPTSTFEFNRGYLISSFTNNPQILNIKNDFSVWGTFTGATGIESQMHLRYAIDDKPQEYTSKEFNFTFRTQENKDAYIAAGNTYDYPAVDWRELIYLMAYDQMKGKIAYTDSAYSNYFPDMLAFWRLLYRPVFLDSFVEGYNVTWSSLFGDEEENNEDVGITIDDWEYNNGWNPECIYYNSDTQTISFIEPTTLIFWIDFLDNDSELSKYKVSAIGRRSKVINDSQIKAMFYKETPNILFISGENEDDNLSEDEKISYTRVNLPDYLENYFRISTQGKSAQEVLEGLLYECSCYAESISIQCVPIYTLEPNTRITVSDPNSGIEGEYIIKTISLPLSYDALMTINAHKVYDSIL